MEATDKGDGQPNDNDDALVSALGGLLMSTIEMTDREPERDDLERVNCDKAGEFGHFMCGICAEHTKPRFECGCMVMNHRKKIGEIDE